MNNLSGSGLSEGASVEETLIYFADPMCSWCWGFSSIIEEIVREFEEQLQFRLVLAGLYPAPGLRLNAESRQRIRKHWEHVQSVTGAEFDYRFFDREKFLYNTEPASRAVLTAGKIDPHNVLPFMRHLQYAFYVNNIDITVDDELMRQAVSHGFDRKSFMATFNSAECAREVSGNFGAARAASVDGLPALFAVDASGSVRISSGYISQEQVRARLTSWLLSSKRGE